MIPNPDIAIFGDERGKATSEDLGKEGGTPYRYLLTRENLGVYRDAHGQTGLQRRASILDGLDGGVLKRQDKILDIADVGVLGGGGDRTHVPLVIIGKNPSVATATKPDNTITKEIGFAQRLGFGRLVKANMHGWREKEAALMWKAQKAGKDIVGAENAILLKNALWQAWSFDGMVLVAWGKGCAPDRVTALREMVDELLESMTKAWHWHHPDFVPLWCLRTNNDGSPEHPLYIPYATAPVPWKWPTC